METVVTENLNYRNAVTLQAVVMASTLRRSIDGIPTQQRGINIDERSLFSAEKVFLRKLRMDGAFTQAEEASMDILLATAKEIEQKIGGRPDVVVWLNVHPNTCYQRIGTRDQPDDGAIQLAELRAIHVLHSKMISEIVNNGTTVVMLDEVQQHQRSRQMTELASYLESFAAWEEDEGKPVYLTIQKPKVE